MMYSTAALSCIQESTVQFSAVIDCWTIFWCWPMSWLHTVSWFKLPHLSPS